LELKKILGRKKEGRGLCSIGVRETSGVFFCGKKALTAKPRVRGTSGNVEREGREVCKGRSLIE